jgi:hypothetical protein
MSGFLGALAGTVISGPLNQALETVFFRTQRGIQLPNQPILVPDCAIEEVGRDDLQITEHPVELGAVISDHAFKKPQEVTLRWAWSNSDPAHFSFSNLLNQNASGFGSLFSENFVIDTYKNLITLQKQRIPFTLYTGKFKYANMVIASLGQTTNAASEYSLMTVIVCREVITVSLSAASITSLNPSAADQPTVAPVNQANSQQAVPQTSTTTGGQQQTFGTGIVNNTITGPDAAGAASSLGSGTNPLYAVTNAQGTVSGLANSPVFPGQLPFTGSLFNPPPVGE